MQPSLTSVDDCKAGCALSSDCAGVGWISGQCQFFTRANLYTIQVGTSVGDDMYQLLNRTGSSCPGGNSYSLLL